MIAFVADIHGNLPALQAVLAEIDACGVHDIISLGDVAGYYSQVDECIDLLVGRRVRNILGNHDWYLIAHKPCPRSNSANLALAYQRAHISSHSLRWLAESPRRLDTQDISCVHGGWRDPLDEYLTDASEEYFEAMDVSHCFSGHTHVQTLKTYGSVCHCNPGSVGQPRDGDPRAAFALFDGETVELRRVPYDIDLVAKSMEERGFGAHFYEGLYVGRPIGARATADRKA
jgi:putative phosphoesterase